MREGNGDQESSRWCYSSKNNRSTQMVDMYIEAWKFVLGSNWPLQVGLCSFATQFTDNYEPYLSGLILCFPTSLISSKSGPWSIHMMWISFFTTNGYTLSIPGERLIRRRRMGKRRSHPQQLRISCGLFMMHLSTSGTFLFSLILQPCMRIRVWRMLWHFLCFCLAISVTVFYGCLKCLVAESQIHDTHSEL
jgi:hypothetical protein